MHKQSQPKARTVLTLPPDVRQAVEEAAKAEERTFNRQIVATLRAALLPQQQRQPAQEVSQ